MNTTQLILINILRSFATECKEKPNIDSADMTALFRLAKTHSVVGIVAYVLDKFDLFEESQHREMFMHEYDRTVMTMLSREISAVNICKELEKLSIEHILFKGMMVSSAYPVPSLRTYSDVDIIIREGDVQKLCEYMHKYGYSHSIADVGVVNVFHKNKEYYEFHSNLNVSNLKDKSYFEKMWNNVIQRDNLTYAFEHNFHLCYLITHLEKHVYGSGAGLRMYLDIVLYILKYRDDIDLDKIRDILTSVGLGSFLNTVLFVCNKWFNLSVPCWVTPMADDVYEKMCEFTLSGGVFGDRSPRKNIENALRQNMSQGKKNAKIRFFFRRVFPPFYELSRFYPRYRGKPYLAPIAWINHVFRFFGDKKYRRVKMVSSVSTETAKQKKEFLESIGSVH